MSSDNPQALLRDTKEFKRLYSNLTKKTLWLYVLSLLQKEDQYGYSLRKAIAEQYEFTPATVSSYVVLYRLEKEGLVKKSERSSNEGNKPERKYYEITSKGEELLKEAKTFLEETHQKLFGERV